MGQVQKRLGGGLLAVGGVWLLAELSSWSLSRVLDEVFERLTLEGLKSLPWSVILPTGVILFGLWLVISSFFSPKSCARIDTAFGLYESAQGFVDQVDYDRRLDWYRREFAADTVALARDAISLVLTFRNAGFKVPELKHQSAEKVCAGAREYFAALAPLIRDGHIAHAKNASEQAARRADETAAAFEPNSWFLKSA